VRHSYEMRECGGEAERLSLKRHLSTSAFDFNCPLCNHMERHGKSR
jgi:hypothetical protein